MTKKLLKDIQEYRQWAYDISTLHEHYKVDDALGLDISYDCWDTNDNGEDINEDGSVIPKLTPENMKLENWVKDLIFPVVAVYWIEESDDRLCGRIAIAVDFVSIDEFKYRVNNFVKDILGSLINDKKGDFTQLNDIIDYRENLTKLKKEVYENSLNEFLDRSSYYVVETNGANEILN